MTEFMSGDLLDAFQVLCYLYSVTVIDVKLKV